jgi:RimJ/RimL family protein N-acetyltransferase
MTRPPAHDADDPTPLDALFNELDGEGWPVALLKRRLAELLTHAPSLRPEARCRWLVGLHDVWQRHGRALARDSRQALLELAAAWCAWPLAYSIGQALHCDEPLDGEHALLMIDACRQLGDGGNAVDLVVRLQLLHPAERAYADCHHELLSWMRWRSGLPLMDDTRDEDGELWLEPLAHHHVADFAWQYYDPVIAELCGLPFFEDDAHWHCWLDDLYGGADRCMFAVLHREWGFIGCVCLSMHESVGFFYYWLGRDFQGLGFGPRAGALLLKMARSRYGMQCCFAKVYDYNTPSQSALVKLGFEALGICGVVPDDDQLFYRFGETRAAQRVAHELHALLERMDSNVRAAVPVYSLQ